MDDEHDNCWVENFEEDNEDGYLASVDIFYKNLKTINSIIDDCSSNIADDAVSPQNIADSEEHVCVLDDDIEIMKGNHFFHLLLRNYSICMFPNFTTVGNILK